MRLGFLASGGGSNMQAIIDACANGSLRAEPAVVIGNNSRSGALQRARRAGISSYHMSSHTHPEPEALDSAIEQKLTEHGADLVCLAGYLKLLGARTLETFRGRILNIHPALLPKFGGRGFHGRAVHEAVLAAGESESGASVHLVDDQYDHGAVIAQARVSVVAGDTPETLAARVLEQEHMLYTDTLRKIAAGDIDLTFYR